MNIALHMLSIEQHTSANHYGLLSRHGWGFVLKPKRVRVFLKSKYKIKTTENAHLIKILSDISRKPFKNTIHFFFLRRTAANYTTAILNAQPESSNQNKAKACSTRVTLSWWGSPALPCTLLPAPWLLSSPALTQQDDTSFLPSFFPFHTIPLPFSFRWPKSYTGMPTCTKVTQECLHAHIQNLTHRKGTTITQQFPQVQGLVLLTNI